MASVITGEILDILAEMADEIEKAQDDSCSMCRAHDEHEVCEPFDVASAIRRFIERKRKEPIAISPRAPERWDTGFIGSTER